MVEVFLVSHFEDVLLPEEPYVKFFDSNNSQLRHELYSDLTAHYQLYINSKSKIKGVYQYRRYLVVGCKSITNLFNNKPFTNILSEARIVGDLKKFDIILPKRKKKIFFSHVSTYDNYCLSHNKDDINLVWNFFETVYTQYLNEFKIVMNTDFRMLYYDNIFISKDSIFNDYCEWLFPILRFVEKKTTYLDRDSYQMRSLGFLAERLLNVYLKVNNYRIKEYPLEVLSKNQEKLSGLKMIFHMLYKIKLILVKVIKNSIDLK